MSDSEITTAELGTMIQSHLFSLQDKKYKAFQCRLMPGVDPETVIGVRIPKLRAFAKELSGKTFVPAFLSVLPHQYFEENNLHAFLLDSITDFDEAVTAVNVFLPFVNNWATCDMMKLHVFEKNTARLYDEIMRWIHSGRVYSVRFGVGLLMSYYLDQKFKPEMLTVAADIRSNEYYINMMTAWYFATALAKQYECTVPFLQDKKLDRWTHNKTIQKAIESYRITDEQKTYLRTLKI